MTTRLATADLRARSKPRDRAQSGPGPLDGHGRFAAFVAHELRTQVALQLTLAQAALADPHGDTLTLREMGEDVVASCEQQQRLIDALLDLTLSQCGLKRQATVDIAPITNRTLQAHQLGELDSAVALQTAVATGDPTLLELLAANLISNAAQHNIPRGRIEVATWTEAGCAALCVANTGPLIPAAELARLFQPFERLRPRLQGGANGVGLGLAIVQAIADAHDATIAAHARVGGGLRIEIRFPPARFAGRSRGTIAVNARAMGSAA